MAAKKTTLPAKAAKKAVPAKPAKKAAAMPPWLSNAPGPAKKAVAAKLAAKKGYKK